MNEKRNRDVSIKISFYNVLFILVFKLEWEIFLKYT